MIRINNIQLNFEDEAFLETEIAKKLKTKDKFNFKIVKKAVDARKRDSIKFVYTVDVNISNEEKYLKLKDVSKTKEFNYSVGKVNMDTHPVVIGSGPAGLFCALRLAMAGTKPFIIEQGSDVVTRKEKIDRFFETGELDRYNNIQFGEGGAGTFSDGKLTTNIKDERINFVLKTFVNNGAPEEILYKAKPHIGTDYLIEVVQNMRKEIEMLGGTFLFDTKFLGYKRSVDGGLNVYLQKLTDGEEFKLNTTHLALAIGHSSRDTFNTLHHKGVSMETKPFSVGFRIEHSQKFINSTQYSVEIAENEESVKTLGSADYKINAHLENGKGIYTFCMCPGGYVVNAASERGTVLTNGMSNFARDAENANSAVLLSVNKEDYEKVTGNLTVLSGIEFQRHFEKLAFEIGGKNYGAPVQLVEDFLNNKTTTELGKIQPTILPSYKFVNFNDHLPQYICESLKEGLRLLDTKIKGFTGNDSIITGFETRSSSPVKINRDENYETNVKNLYVCGEGCGFAGGITSSAVDGLKCAEKMLGNS